MISFFNKIANSWVAKIILAALSLSMLAFWGLGGIGTTASRDIVAITVGSHKVSMPQLVAAFETERTKLSQLTSQYISPKQAFEMGLLQQAVQKQVAKLVNQSIQEDLGLIASDAAVRKYVERHPAFKDVLDKFDRGLYLAYLNQNKMTEAELAVQLRDELANQHLSNTIRLLAPTSKFWAQKVWMNQNETRDVEGLLIETDKIALTEQPTAEELKDYYDENISDFMEPEVRDIVLLTLTPESVASTIQISKEQLDELYSERKDNFGTPEKRHILQMRFATSEEANKMLQGLTAQNFSQKATEIGQVEKQTDFGIVAQNELLPEIADAAFKAQKNTVLGPIETQVGWHLLTVTEIQPAIIPSKTDIYADLRKELITNSTYDVLYEKARELEDLLGEGQTLVDAAHKLGLSTTTYKNIDITGKSLPESAQDQELLMELFTLKNGETTALIEQGNGYLIAETTAIASAHPKPFKQVYSEIKKIWQQEQQKSRLPELAEHATEEMKKGSIPAKWGEVTVERNVSRQEPGQIPVQAISNIFAQKKGYEYATATVLPNGAFISVVKKTKAPKWDATVLPDQMEQLSAENAELLASGLVETYAQNLGISINTEAIQQAFDVYKKDE